MKRSKKIGIILDKMVMGSSSFYQVNVIPLDSLQIDLEENTLLGSVAAYQVPGAVLTHSSNTQHLD